MDKLEVVAYGNTHYRIVSYVKWSDDCEPLVTLANAEAMIKQARREERERCAKVIAPKTPRPCDCLRCDCRNSGDMLAVELWDASSNDASKIRALGDEE